MSNSKKKRFRLSLRMFFLVCGIAAIAIGQFIIRAKKQQLAVALCLNSGGLAIYDIDYDYKKHVRSALPAETKWYNSESFRDYFTNVVYLHVRSEDFDPTLFNYLPRLDRLNFYNVQQDELQFLKGQKNLVALHVSGDEINPINDIEPLTKLKNLDQICLSNVTLSDLKPLCKLKKLLAVKLGDCEIKDFTALTEIKGLLLIGIYRTAIDDDQLMILKRELPNCTIQLLNGPVNRPDVG